MRIVYKKLFRQAMLFAMLMTISIGMIAQNVSLKADNKPLSEVLSLITKSTGYKFVYSSAMQDKLATTVSINCTNANLKNVLNQLFDGKKINYKIEGKNIALAPLSISPAGQEKKSESVVITGKIIDENGEPLPGVYVQSASGNKAASDIDGHFSINAADRENLSLQCIGMKDMTIPADGRKNMIIVLKSDVIALDDVVVTGYQSISKERATGSFNIVKADQLQKPSTNIAQRLIGTTSGLQSTTDANGDVTFEIRGQSSLLASAQPLVVVDGFPTQDSFNSINPNDVESISILKDAAAASIWGAKSANGVIVITTKKGANLKKGDVKVDVQTFWKYSPKIDWSYSNPNATSAETIDYEQRGYNANGFFGSAYWMPNQDNYQDYGDHSLAVTAMNEFRLGYMSQSELDARLKQLGNQNNAGQIKKYMLDNPFTQQYNVNISGATERSNNVLSLMYEQQDKYLKGNSSNKYNVGYRTSVKLYKWLDFNFNGNFNYTESKNNAISYEDLSSLSPYQMLVNEDGSRNYEMMGYNYYDSSAYPSGYTSVSTLYAPNVKRYFPLHNFPYSDLTYNPISEREGRDYRTTKMSVRAQAGLTAHIIEGLTIDSKFQYEAIQTNVKNIDDESTAFVRNLVTQTSSWDKKTNEVVANLPMGGVMKQNKSSVDSYNWRNQINFDRSFSDGKHQISVIAGSEISNIVTKATYYATTYGYDDDKLTVGGFPNGVGGSGAYRLTSWMGSSQAFAYTNQYFYNTERYFSLYANASYTFNHKYTISGSARTDASNLITDDPKYRYAPFWSVGASWVASEEKFLKNIDWLDRLTVRGTFGYNGNVDRSTSFMPLIKVNTTQNSYIHDYTASISSYGNPTLRWEKTGSLDFGIDFSMFKGKLYGKIDGYDKEGKDLIVSMTIPSVNGSTSQKLNAAEMTNRGIEVELGSTLNIYNRDIVWTGGLTFSYNKNKITKLFRDSYESYDLYDGGTSSYVQGFNANTLWSYQYAGVVNVGTDSSPVMRPVVKGINGTYNDFTGWASGDAREFMANSGTLVAPYVMSLSSSFKIYDFNLSFIFTGKFGHVFRGLSFNYPAMTGGSANPNKVYNEVLNCDPSKMVPIPWDGEERYYFWDRYYPYLDYLVQKAGHIRCQEISIAYNVPQSILKRLRFTKAQIYAQGNNLFTISNNKYNEDPEYPIGTIKPTASFTFGLNFTF